MFCFYLTKFKIEMMIKNSFKLNHHIDLFHHLNLNLNLNVRPFSKRTIITEKLKSPNLQYNYKANNNYKDKEYKRNRNDHYRKYKFGWPSPNRKIYATASLICSTIHSNEEFCHCEFNYGSYYADGFEICNLCFKRKLATNFFSHREEYKIHRSQHI